MTSALSKRLARLEALLEARTATPIWRWMMDADADPAAELERMVADGEIAAKDVARVQLFRWLTEEEAVARGMALPPEPPEPYVQPQLPAPPELKLLPAPAAPSPGEEAGSDDDPFTLRRAVPPQGPKDPFHDPVGYPKVGWGV